MKRLTLYPWVAVLTLAIAVAPGAASAQEDGTITISSTFYMDWLVGTVGPDLAEVFANGHEHTWTLTLHGTSHSHYLFSNMYYAMEYYATEIHATSFDLEFFGPDAATLNGIVSDHIAGGDVSIYLDNEYSSGIDGYPVVGQEPFSTSVAYSELDDMRPGNNGAIQSRASLVTIEGSMGEPEPVVLAVTDATVLEGDRGTSNMTVAVTI